METLSSQLDYMTEHHTCPECGSHVETVSYTLECDHCLSKREE